jgi:hypothetical protein
MHNYHDTYRRFPSGWLAAHPDDPSGADSWAWSVMAHSKTKNREVQ